MANSNDQHLLELIWTHRDRLIRIAEGLTNGNRADSEYLADEAMMVGFEKIKQLKDRKALEKWLETILQRRWMDKSSLGRNVDRDQLVQTLPDDEDVYIGPQDYWTLFVRLSILYHYVPPAVQKNIESILRDPTDSNCVNVPRRRAVQLIKGHYARHLAEVEEIFHLSNNILIWIGDTISRAREKGHQLSRIGLLATWAAVHRNDSDVFERLLVEILKRIKHAATGTPIAKESDFNLIVAAIAAIDIMRLELMDHDGNWVRNAIDLAFAATQSHRMSGLVLNLLRR
jgi:hypothetical protein